MIKLAKKQEDVRILFVHVPKSGGMSLYNALADAVGKRRSIRFYSASEEQKEKYLAMDEKSLRKHALISGHFSYPFFLKKAISDYKPITLIRDPIDRELSAYFYMKTHQEHPMYDRLKKVDLYEFVNRRLKRTQGNRHCHQLCGEGTFEAAKKVIDENYYLVSTVEYMNEFCQILQRNLGIEKIDIKRDNETLFRMSRKELHPDLIDKIAQLNKEDIKLYNYVKTKFEREYLSQKKVPALFLHIQKTAGTTIVDQAWKHYGYSVCSHGDFEGKQLSDLTNRNFISGHFGYDFAKPLLKSRYSFTFLRDPIERILSFYYFCRTRNTEEREIYSIAHSMGLESFLRAGFEHPLVKSLIWNSQTWRLACGFPNADSRSIEDFTDDELFNLAKAHLDEFSHVGFTETFEKDQEIILSALNMPMPTDKAASNVNPDRPRLEDVPQQCRQLLNELTSIDRRLYDYAWSVRQ